MGLFTVEKQNETEVPQQSGRLWRDGETRTMGKQGGAIGLMVGFIFSLIIAGVVAVETSFAVNGAGKTFFLVSLILVVGTLFGGVAGILVGFGVPMFNPRPHQGHLASIFRSRRDLKK